MPKKIEEFITNLNTRIGKIQAQEREKILKELENVEGFIEEDNTEQTEYLLKYVLKFVLSKNN